MANENFYFGTETSPILRKSCVIVGGYKDGAYHPCGTGTFIGHNLIITAQHVLDDIYRYYKYKDIKYLEPTTDTKGPVDMHLNYHVFAMQAIDINDPETLQGGSPSIWNVKRAFIPGNSDIVYLYVEPQTPITKSNKPKWASLQVLPPEVGSQVFTFGYDHTEIATTGHFEDEDFKVSINCRPKFSAGIVREVFHEQRDHMMRFPCINANFRMDGGMSGGPIFNHDGELVAINSMNFPPDPEDSSQEHISSGALIWPTMRTLIDVERKLMSSIDNYPILDLAQTGQIRVGNLDKLKLIHNQTGKIVRTQLNLPNGESYII